jgi:hypothetical protein
VIVERNELDVGESVEVPDMRTFVERKSNPP